MKHLLILLSLLVILPIQAQEQILNYDVAITVEEDGTLDVIETIQVNSLHQKIKRGIYRDFPHITKGKWGATHNHPFDVVSVKRNNEPEHYVIERQTGGSRVKIGRAQHMLPKEVHTYEIHYRTGDWMLSHEESDELYWNVTGNHWQFPIMSSSCTIKFPPGARCSNAEAYTGAAGDKMGNYDVNQAGSTVTFHTTGPLKVKEGWTVSALIPKGYVTIEEPGIPISILLILAGLIATITWFLGAWYMVGVDPKKGVIFPRFTIPGELSAAAVRHLKKMGYDNDCFTAGIVGIAQKGWVKIQQSSSSFTLIRVDAPENHTLTADEQALYDQVIKPNDRLRLHNKNHKIISSGRKAHEQALKKINLGIHYHRNLKWTLVGVLLSLATIGIALHHFGSPTTIFLSIWLTIWTFGCLALVSTWIKAFIQKNFLKALPTFLLSLPFLAAWCFGALAFTKTSSPILLVLLILLAALCLLFYHLMKAPTRLGRKVLDHIDGLKHYLSVAEKDRLNLADVPPATPEHYEEFLPYALALGVSDNWTDSFADVLKQAAIATNKQDYQPHFYHGSITSSRGFLTGAALGAALGTALASAASAPSSSGGSGGGGSSGGGGGGGGGGGW